MSDQTPKAQFHVLTLFPEMITSLFSEGVVGQAAKKGWITIEAINPRKHTTGVHHSVDDRPFGGGDGMVMMPGPLELTLAEVRQKAPDSQVYFLSPQGQRLDDAKVRELAQNPQLVLICGRYAGIDQRFLVKNKVQEISIGDYVLSGGELAAAVIIDTVARQLPGILGHADSALNESFSTGLLEAPLFTRPREWEGYQVPEILLSGNHAKINEWQQGISCIITFQKRADLDPFGGLSKKEREKMWKLWLSLSNAEKESLGLKELSEASLREVLSC